MNILVISLGGSVMIPGDINYNFIKKFREVLKKNYSNYKFVVVCGGGSIARKYINALRKEHKNPKQLSLSGIRATRMNALFLMEFFGNEANNILPMDMIDVKNSLRKNNVVICGALRFSDRSTSDATSAKLAGYLKTDFINITNVEGLYDRDPRQSKNAKFIKKIGWSAFNEGVKKMNFEAGQHFVLDQEAARIIKNKKIRTIIVGPDIENFDRLLNQKPFKGTLIEK
jgi:uridylate kinase